MLPLQLALVSEVKQVKAAELCRVSAALQRQVARDFAPIWQINATVDAFITLEDVPVGYWPMIVETQLDQPGAAGIHLDKDGQPFSLIEFNGTWSLTASHECLEMLADPFGNRLAAGQSPKSNQGRVEFLVEVADPCEAAAFSYRVNGQMVSDFYTPQYFDPIKASGTRYSFTGAVTAPRTVLEGGYISWHEPITDHWWQLFVTGGKRKFRDLGVFSAIKENLRAMTDSRTPFDEIAPELKAGVSRTSATFGALTAALTANDKATSSKAASLRAQIKALKAGK
jgi:hypothetical protein